MKLLVWLTLANVILGIFHLAYLHLNLTLNLSVAHAGGDEELAFAPRLPCPVTIPSPHLKPSTHHNSNSDFNNNTSDDECWGLQGSKVLFLDVHLEGNLGDEMETTPVLQDWHRCGVDITVALSEWRNSKERLHSRTTREQHLVSTISSQKYSNYNPNDYDLIVLAPGPWKPCELYHQYYPYAQKVNVFLGGSFMKDDSACDTISTSSRMTNTGELLRDYYYGKGELSLVVPREPVSFQFAQEAYKKKHSLKDETNTKLFLGGDLSYSYRPALAAMEYWQEYYQRLFQGGSITLIFSRAQNFARGVRIVKQKGKEDDRAYTVMLKMVNGSKVQLDTTSKDHRLVFSSSSDLEDVDHFEFLRQTYPMFRSGNINNKNDNLILCQSVEELWALISLAKHVYTDRYHPGVAAHILNVSFDVLSYPAEQVKLNGLVQATQQHPNQTASHWHQVNQEALGMVRDLLREKRSQREKQQSKMTPHTGVDS